MRRISLSIALLMTACAPQMPGQSTIPNEIFPVGQAVPPSPGAFLREIAAYRLPSYPVNIVFDSLGGALLNCSGTVVEVQVGGAPQTRFSLNSGLTSILFITTGDQLWETVSGGGVNKLSSTGELLKSYSGPSSDWSAQAFVLDRDGNPWVSYDFGSKIYKYSPDGTRLLDLDIGAMRGLFLDSQGTVVAGSSTRVTWLAPDGTVRRQHDLGQNFSGFGLDAEDNVWALEQDERGTIYRLKPDDTLETFNPTASRIGNFVVAPHGGVWFTTDHTLHRIDDAGKLVGSYDLGDGFSSLALDPAGYLWAGYQRKEGETYFGEAKKFAIE